MADKAKAKAPKTTCRSCGAQILFAKMKHTGRLMPLDVKPVQLVQISWDEKRGEVVGEMVGGFVSHFATCPNADQHRKGGREKKPKSGGK